MNSWPAFPPVPSDTARAAQNWVAKDSPFGTISDAMASLFALCAPATGEVRSIEGPVLFLQRAVITLLQAAESLTDRQAEKAMQARVEWSYALHLPLEHDEFPAYEFCLFRQRLFSEPVAGALFQAIQERVAALRLWPGLPVEPRPFTQVLSFVCRLNQASWYAEAMGQAVEELAACHPDLLRQIALPHWYALYTVNRNDQSGLPPYGAGQSAYETIRKDIAYLLTALALCEDEAPARLPEVRRLRHKWRQDCDLCDRRERLCVVCAGCVVGANIAEAGQVRVTTGRMDRSATSGQR